jgi:hypothetical protein
MKHRYSGEFSAESSKEDSTNKVGNSNEFSTNKLEIPPTKLEILMKNSIDTLMKHRYSGEFSIDTLMKHRYALENSSRYL